jgi:hydrogenase maturation protein HypF
MTKKTVEINITGIVQGVGFRPFLFNIAKKNMLNGYILNRGNAGVRLILQGESKDIKNFIIKIQKDKPEISFIENLNIKELESDKSYTKLEIKKSEEGRGTSLTLPPDIAICDNCLKDMRNKRLQKYFNYPFIACALCGPRFTTVKKLPYDRERTTMNDFPFCKNANPISCLKEYSDFNNRRFHAQTFACSVCGPNYQLYDNSKHLIQHDNIESILIETSNRINTGEIVAVKGIGGVHLVCLADNDEIILKLRKRKKKREYKPFALMIPNLGLIKDEFHVSKKEQELLNSFRRPIVLLERKNVNKSSIISDQVAPGLNNVGVMLPYSGIHYLLFDYVGNKPLIYTSGNKSNIPMGIDNDKIFEQLENLADIFLLHNRPIYQRADDSVLRIHGNKVKLIRRSRGYVPEYLPLPFDVDVPGALATGPLLANTGAILRGNRIFPTQHIGNVSHLETYEFLKDALSHMKNLLQINDSEIEFISCDAHPAFISTTLATELAEQFNCEVYKIQHHFAHLLGLMAENNIDKDEEIIGICTDGVGFGEDGNIWGGEILLCSYNRYKRLGRLEYQPMIGGDRCTKYPARMAASIILKNLDSEKAAQIFNKIGLENDLEYKKTELQTLISMFEKSDNRFPSENIPLSSSTGRIFDTVSYLLGVSNIKTYRGEPAMRLEGLASNGNPEEIKLRLGFYKQNRNYIINTSQLILNILDLLKDPKNKRQDIAAKFQIEIGKIFASIAIKIAEENGINKIGLSGGVAYNYSFSRTIKHEITQAGYKFLEHNLIAPGDAGISIGQLIGGLFQHFKEK